jgi:hypothetical protein
MDIFCHLVVKASGSAAKPTEQELLTPDPPQEKAMAALFSETGDDDFTPGQDRS